MTRLGMVIDLKKCVSCYGCVASCKVENFTRPDIFWSWIEKEDLPSGWVDDEDVLKSTSFDRVSVPLLCMHCGDPDKGETAPCQDACPTGATQKRDDGIVTIDPTKCIGCKFCMEACPYGARTQNPKDPESYYPEGITEWEQFRKRFPDDDHRRHTPGTVGKCVFCKHRVDDGMDPKCVTNCISNARYFGDINDPDSEVSRLIEEHDGFQLSPEHDTNPAVYYLPPR